MERRNIAHRRGKVEHRFRTLSGTLCQTRRRMADRFTQTDPPARGHAPIIMERAAHSRPPDSSIPLKMKIGDMQDVAHIIRSEEHTSELQSLMRISYAVFCLKKKNHTTTNKIK